MTRYTLYLGDCLSWMEKREKDSIHAIVTDPPYGLKEYTTVEKEKLRNGNGGVSGFLRHLTAASDALCRVLRFLPRATAQSSKDFFRNLPAAQSAFCSRAGICLLLQIPCSHTLFICRW